MVSSKFLEMFLLQTLWFVNGNVIDSSSIQALKVLWIYYYAVHVLVLVDPVWQCST